VAELPAGQVCFPHLAHLGPYSANKIFIRRCALREGRIVQAVLGAITSLAPPQFQQLGYDLLDGGVLQGQVYRRLHIPQSMEHLYVFVLNGNCNHVLILLPGLPRSQFAILLAVYLQRRDWWGAGQSWLSGLLQQLEISFPADSGCGQVRADMRYGHVPYFRQVRPLAD